MKGKTIAILAILFFILLGINAEGKELEDFLSLLKEKKFEEAETLCLQFKKTQQNAAFKLLANAFIGEENIPKAIEYIQKADYKKGYNKLGAYYFKQKDLPKALEYCEKGIPAFTKSQVYEALAKDLQKENPHDIQAKTYYTKAVENCKFLMYTFGYEWEKAYFPLLKRCVTALKVFPKSPEETAMEDRLDKVMRKAATYCDRLRKSAFHFFCNEKISEFIDHKIDWKGNVFRRSTSLKQTFLYEYQLLKENGEITETRTMKRRLGVKVNEPNAELQTMGFKYERLIFGPVALMGRYWFPFHHYSIVKEENIKGENFVVIDTFPLEHLKDNHLFGKIWVSETDGSILKIIYCPKSMGSSDRFVKTEEKYGAKADVLFCAEFEVFKRGIRFPSRYRINETYVFPDGKRFLRYKMDSKLNKYLFFTVGTEIIDQKGEK